MLSNQDVFILTTKGTQFLKFNLASLFVAFLLFILLSPLQIDFSLTHFLGITKLIFVSQPLNENLEKKNEVSLTTFFSSDLQDLSFSYHYWRWTGFITAVSTWPFGCTSDTIPVQVPFSIGIKRAKEKKKLFTILSLPHPLLLDVWVNDTCLSF